MSVTFDNVTPGIALSPGDASKLKKEISAFVQGAGLTTGKVTWPDFRDEDRNKRKVVFTILRVNGGDIHVALETYERRG